MFIHCAFSNVPSNRLPVRMQSHIGYICLAFLHCVFLNVPLSRLSERMHNNIGCIFFTFLLCVFSTVSIKNLDKSRQSHIGCIWLTFLHCTFLNVFSKHQLEKMQSHISCNYAEHSELCAALCGRNCVWHCALVSKCIPIIPFPARQFGKFSMRPQLCAAMSATKGII